MNIKKIISVMFLVILMMTGCTKKINNYTEIDYNQFMEKINNKDSFPLFVGSNDCSHCDDYKVTIEKLVKEYQIDVYYIDIAKMSSEEYKKFTAMINFGGSTPTTVFITNGIEETVYDRIVGALQYSKVVNKFKKAGYIKEK